MGCIHYNKVFAHYALFWRRLLIYNTVQCMFHICCDAKNGTFVCYFFCKIFFRSCAWFWFLFIVL